MTHARPHDLHFRVGARTLFSVGRRLVRVPFSLEMTRADDVPSLPPLAPDADGYLITSLPAPLADRIAATQPALGVHLRQRYMRRYADLRMGYDAYLAGMPSRARSDLRRKTRRFAERFGSIDVRRYRTVEEVATFHALARAISSKTYQERLLDAGLPDEPEALASAAARDAVRGFLLFADGQPISYLHLPIERDTLVYAHLGYDPGYGEWSPGSVLQIEAMRLLMDERRFAWLDFTEGDGQHKRAFATGAVDCVDLLLLRRSAANLASIGALQGFDRLVSLGARLAKRPLLRPLVKAIRR